MASMQVKENFEAVVHAAAVITCDNLNNAITAHGQAVWMLAGGTVPAAVYTEMARDCQDKLSWLKVYAAMGDERAVPPEDPASNWLQARTELFDHVPLPRDHLFPPDMRLPLAQAAAHYQQILLNLPQVRPGLPRIDHLWLGVGEDGHTLSLFPGHPSLAVTAALVIPVHNAPKPPPDRISLTLRALRGVETCLIMAAGAGKTAIIAQALEGDQTLPIVQAVNTIERAGGTVTWLVDKAAAGK